MHTFLVVVYRRRFSDVLTLKTLLTMDVPDPANTSLFVWDNSPPDFSQESSDNLKSFRLNFSEVNYFRAPENRSLSAVYNGVLDSCFSKADGKVTILDHDSEIPGDFGIKMGNVYGARLGVPKVRSNRTGQMISPRYQRSYNLTLRPSPPRMFLTNESGEYASKDLFAVGSGLTIPKELWKTGLRFDENLAFYGIDTEFCRDYSGLCSIFMLMDTTVVHDVSSEGCENVDTVRWRFNVHMDYWNYQLKKYTSFPPFAIKLYVGFWRCLINFNFRLKRIRDARAR